jgi:hypothetical protein
MAWKNIELVNPITGEPDFSSLQVELNNRLRYYLSHIDLSSLVIGSTGSLTLYQVNASTANLAYISSTGSATFNTLASSSAVIGQLGSTGSARFNILTSSSAVIGQLGSTGSATFNTITSSSAVIGQLGSTGSAEFNILTSSSAVIGQLGSTGSAEFNILTSSSAVIPYINSTASLSVQKIAFNITPSTDPLSEGELRWNDSDKTLNVQTENVDVTLQVGQELYIRATNKTTGDVTNGQVVYIDGAQGNRPTVALAQATTDFSVQNSIGLVTHDIAKNNTGYISTFGLVRDIDTSAFTEGDLLYLSSTTPGGIVNVKPSKPYVAIKVGYVVISSTAGAVLLNVNNGNTLQDLHDTCISSLVSGQLLVYNTSSGVWSNTSILNSFASSSAVIGQLGSTGSAEFNILTSSSAVIGQLGSTGSATFNTITSSSAVIGQLGSTGSATFNTITSSSAVIGQLGSTGSATFNTITSSSAVIGQLGSTGSATFNILTSSSGTFTELKASSAIFGNSTSYSKFESDGTYVAFGDARTYRDELGDVTKLKIVGSAITEDTTDTTINYSTNATLTSFQYTNMQLNHDRVASEVIYPHFHWLQSSGNTPNMLIQFRYCANLSTVADWTYLKCDNLATTYPGGTFHQIGITTGITPPSNSTVSDVIQFKIYRDTLNASGLFASTDNYSLPVKLMSFDAHIITDMLGSRTEYVK